MATEQIACRNCVFVHEELPEQPEKTGVLYCRRNPPVVVNAGSADHPRLVGAWPAVESNDWCAAFVADPEAALVLSQDGEHLPPNFADARGIELRELAPV